MIEKLDIIDSIDRKILALMKDDCRISRQKIANELGISRQTVQNRIKALEDNGIILKYMIITNEKKLGKDVTALILVMLDRTKQTWSFTEESLLSRQKELEIVEMHHIAGDFDVLIKMKTRNLDSLEYNILKIVNMPGVARTRTMICLSSYEQGYPMKSADSDKIQTELLWNLV
ncbi:MAG: Lrp/AsnC family transcriptional regulator [Candidatus Hodarchaeota archaeon]